MRLCARDGYHFGGDPRLVRFRWLRGPAITDIKDAQPRGRFDPRGPAPRPHGCQSRSENGDATRTRSLPNHRRADRGRLARPLVRKRDVDTNGPAQVPDLMRESWRCAGLWARRREGLTRDFQAGMGAEREQMTFGFCPSLGPSGQDASCATRGAVAAGSSTAVPVRHSRLGPSSKYRAPLRPSRFALLRKPRAEAAPLWTPSSQIKRHPVTSGGWRCGGGVACSGAHNE